jgi:GWxTD domain-containing protein
MKTRRVLIVAALLALAVANAFAALAPEHVDWGKGPAHFLFTDEEAARWKKIKTDDEAKAFIDLFWARRDPTPATPENEFKADFEMRVKYADEKFSPVRRRGTKGSITDRGMFVILFGTPQRVANQEGSAVRPEMTGVPQTNTEQAAAYQIWTYDGDAARKFFNVPKAEFRFADRYGNQEYSFDRGGPVEVNAAKKRVINAGIVQPNLTAAPTFAAPVTAAPVAAVPVAAPAPVVALTTPALAAAVTDFKAAAKNVYENKAFASWGEYVTTAGETYVPVLLYVPKSTLPAGDPKVTFFGVVEDESGKVVSAFEEPVTLMASKDDFYADKSLMGLPAGKHRGIFGIAANGKPLAIASSTMQLAGAVDKDAPAVSPLILSNNIYALTEAQKATDPFAFGGVKVVPKADKIFRKGDELWYFFELRNPGLSDGEAAEPKVQVKLDIDGKEGGGTPVKMTAPPEQVQATPMKGVPGHYGVGSAIPTDGFEPGTYTFTAKVMDTVRKTSYTLSDTFRIVK